MVLLGVDGTAEGWVTAIGTPDGLSVEMYETFEDLLAEWSPADRILVDIPIGLPEGSRRTCDRRASTVLGCRGISVFYPPCREVVDRRSELDYAEANEIHRRVMDSGLSQQAYHIAPKVRGVDALWEKALPIRESHPEVCFGAFDDYRPIAYPKSSQRGQAIRARILDDRLDGWRTVYESALEEYPRSAVGRDDLLDALVLLATARYESLATLPEDPPADSRGRPMEIAYPETPVPEVFSGENLDW